MAGAGRILTYLLNGCGLEECKLTSHSLSITAEFSVQLIVGWGDTLPNQAYNFLVICIMRLDPFSSELHSFIQHDHKHEVIYIELYESQAKLLISLLFQV